ncbi:mitochondrial membrane protein [Chamberlinius hualienensis]
MDSVLDDVVPVEDLKKFENQYKEQHNRGHILPKTKFEYAWCLVRSNYAADIRRGIFFLEDLVKSGDIEAKRDYLYYLAVGNARIREYNVALMYLENLLSVEPSNSQAKELSKVIQKRMHNEGLMGMAIVGGATLVAGTLLGLAIALVKRH